MAWKIVVLEELTSLTEFFVAGSVFEASIYSEYGWLERTTLTARLTSIIVKQLERQ